MLILVAPFKTKAARSSEELVPTYQTTQKTEFQPKTTAERNMSCTRIEVSYRDTRENEIINKHKKKMHPL